MESEGEKKKPIKKKRWDVTFVAYRSEVIEADTEEEVRGIAEVMKESNERVGVIEETDEEVSEE